MASNKRRQPFLAFALLIAEILLALVSWLLNAAYPVSGIRSLLSGEGIRWFFGLFSDLMATPQLVWIVLFSMAYGSLLQSRLLTSGKSYRESWARWMALLVVGVVLVTMLLLTATPHAVLLSATGNLWPSPFSASLMPVVAFTVLLGSAVYGFVAGTFDTLSDLYDALLMGIRCGAPFLLFYILVMQIVRSLFFVFG